MDELLGAIDRLSQQLRDAGFEEVSYEEEVEVPAAPAPTPTPVPSASYYVPGGWWVFVQEPFRPPPPPPPPQRSNDTVDAVSVLARENAELREEIARLIEAQNTRPPPISRRYAPPPPPPSRSDQTDP